MARAIRGLAIDVYLNDARLEQATFQDTHTPLSYDVVLMQMPQLLRRFRQGEMGFNPRETIDGIPKVGTEAAQALERALSRRRQEFDEFLALGKPLVVFLGPPEEYAVFNRVETRRDPDSGKEIPTQIYDPRKTVERALPFELRVEASRGRRLRAIGTGPFADFWESWGSVFHHEAVIASHPGTTLVTMDGARKAVAATIEHRGGTVLLLPDFEDFNYADTSVDDPENDPAHIDLVDALVKICRLAADQDQPPPWTDEVSLPGETAARRSLAAARTKEREWQVRIQEREAELNRILRRKGLLSASGSALEALVTEALAALGIAVEPGAPGRADRIARLRDRVAVVEIKGQKGSAKESDAAQLTKWVASYHSDHGTQPKGILVVNAFNRTPLSRRKQAAFPSQMLRYAVDQQQYCLVTGAQLLSMWVKVERDPQMRDELAHSLFDCVGIHPEESHSLA